MTEIKKQMGIISRNLSEIKQEIAPYNPKIIAVTKYSDTNAIVEAYQAGLRDFGENRIQDALPKIDSLPIEVKTNSMFHLIGHLQSNKAKKAVKYFDLIHSVDSLKLAQVINEEAEKIGKIQDILLQINNAEEESKFGFDKEVLFDCFGEILDKKNLNIKGVMTIAPKLDDQGELRRLFQEIIQIKDKISNKYGYNLIEVSMGMSNDYKIAVEEGSTMIRVGRRLFF